MTDTPAQKKRFRFWLTVSEVVGVLALVIAGLNFYDSRRQHAEDERRQAAADKAAAGRSSFIMSGAMEGEGARLSLQPLNAGQAIQAQRYIFPRTILDHAMEVSAARPQIDLDWLDAGLRQDVAAKRKAGAGADGEATIPVGVYTTYVEDGDVHTDQSLYRLGYAWRGRLIGGPRLALQGVSLVRRSLSGDLRATVETAWTRQHPKS